MGEGTAGALTSTKVADDVRAERLERRFDVPMLIAALLVIPVIAIEESHVSSAWKHIGTTLNWVIWIAFAFELAIMLVVSQRRMSYLRTHPLEAAIVVLTPPFLPASLGALRLFRMLRLLRVAVVAKELRRLLTPDGIRLAAVLAGSSALAGGAIFADVEKGYSLWDGVWWAITTMATVGYGDLSPKTVVGRLVAIVLMFIGIGFFALVTGAVAQRFISTDVAEIAAGEREIAATEESTREEVLAELRSLTARLQRLEEAVRRL